MSDLRKAAEMALEAFDGPVLKDSTEHAMMLRKACDLLRQALAQPEQEPVAWMNIEDNIFYKYEFKSCAESDESAVPLYTAPPKREWVDLTDDEINHTPFRFTMINGPGDGLLPFAKAVMAKLKEKNT